MRAAGSTVKVALAGCRQISSSCVQSPTPGRVSAWREVSEGCHPTAARLLYLYGVVITGLNNVRKQPAHAISRQALLMLLSTQVSADLCVNLRLVSQHLGQEVDWHLIAVLEAELSCLAPRLLNDAPSISCTRDEAASMRITKHKDMMHTCLAKGTQASLPYPAAPSPACPGTL